MTPNTEPGNRVFIAAFLAPALYLAGIALVALIALSLSGCYSRCEAGHTICGGPYIDAPWFES